MKKPWHPQDELTRPTVTTNHATPPIIPAKQPILAAYLLIFKVHRKYMEQMGTLDDFDAENTHK